MWIRRKTYDDLMRMALEANGAKEALERQVVTQNVTRDWMIHRLTQLEHERAALIYRYMGVKLTVPELTPETPVTEPSNIGSDLPSFNDVGDEEAAKLGLGWDNEGRVTQNGKVIG